METKITILEKNILEGKLKLLDNVLDLLSKSGIKCFIAGGVFASIFTKSKINDIDVFFYEKDDVNNMIEFLKNCNDCKVGFNNDWVCNIYLKNLKLQLVKKYTFVTPEECINSFDFTVCKCAYDGSKIYHSERFFIDLTSKALIVDGLLLKPLSTFKRAFKYQKKGYIICNVGLAKIAKEINKIEIDWENPDQNQIEFYPDGTASFLGLD